MSERAFPCGDWAEDDGVATSLAADLAEQLLDEISRPDHDWSGMWRCATELETLVRAMADRYPSAAGGTPPEPIR